MGCPGAAAEGAGQALVVDSVRGAHGEGAAARRATGAVLPRAMCATDQTNLVRTCALMYSCLRMTSSSWRNLF